ncbi:MAG: type III-A CRISPR-associated RAMP protein Csm5 [Candidatus Bipolaricaulaceae bacterium]
MALKTKFRLAVQVLTPLHIGTGHVLQQDFDYVVRDGQTLRLHEERFLEWIAEKGERFARLTQGVPPGQIIGGEIRPDSPLVRYALPGAPQNTREIRECVKDGWDRPYIPGSSLKGALRTAILWWIWTEESFQLSRFQLGKDPRFAARSVEQEIFGHTPHADLLRALRLHDSYPAGKECLFLASVRCISKAARGGIPLALEAVQPGTTFLVEGHIDETAFRPWGSWENAGFLPSEKRGRLNWENIATAARAKARARLEQDFRWAEKVGINAKPWQELLQLLEKADHGEFQGFPLQMGFGTGWLGTTLGPALLTDPAFPSAVYERYGLGRVPRSSRKTPVQNFPASRRLARVGSVDQPLGWIWIVPKETP